MLNKQYDSAGFLKPKADHIKKEYIACIYFKILYVHNILQSPNTIYHGIYFNVLHFCVCVHKQQLKQIQWHFTISKREGGLLHGKFLQTECTHFLNPICLVNVPHWLPDCTGWLWRNLIAWNYTEQKLLIVGNESGMLIATVWQGPCEIWPHWFQISKVPHVIVIRVSVPRAALF